MPDLSPRLPGWFGKIPALGDFASRRLPPGFISFWDRWLQLGLEGSRASLQGGWLDSYLNGPLWNFALMPGICGDSAWAGTIMPSVDKVGRHFPLTIAVELDPQPEILAAILSAQTWFAAIERVSLDCLDVGFDAARLEQRLASTPFPNWEQNPGQADTARLERWWNEPSVPGFALAVPDRTGIRTVFQDAGLVRQSRTGRSKSLWWSEAATGGEVRLLAFSGMPGGSDFVSLLAGAG
jgi:type VI secretion system protein ImpM